VHETKNHTVLDQNVIKTLLYYDIFHYPLKASEVFRFLRINSVTEKDVANSLDSLVERGYLSRFNEFYSAQPTEHDVSRRIKGNLEAQRCLPIAQHQALFISRFPFVRAVMASGSLSKEYMDENSDFDFFIVTAPSRLWISRTLLVLYKRFFLNNSHKYFCVNYFVDAAHLEIEEKNLFTATELATVIPLYGSEYYQQVIEKNKSWLLDFFPNFIPRPCAQVTLHKRSFFKRIVEGVLNLTIGNFLNSLLMRLTSRRWKQLYEQEYAPPDFKVAFKTKKYVSKNHPQHFQKKVIDLYNEQLALFYRKFDPPSL
jgi:hypothetical protein